MNEIKEYNDLSINKYGTIGSLMNGYLDSYLNRDEIEVINVGTYSVVNGKEYIRYEEVYDDSQERSSSIIKIDGDSVEVTKKGVVSTKMRFTMGSKNMTYYQTPYGNMSLGIITKSLEIERTEDTISIYLVYGMEVNCEHLSDCDMQITITTRELRIDE